MYIKGFNNQGDLRKFLCAKENSLTSSQFFQYLLRLQKEDPQYFYCSAINIGGTQFAFVVGEHPDKRSGFRTFYSRKQLRERCMELLENPFLGSAVTESPICIDDANKCVAWNPDGTMATAIVDEETGLIFIFEAGFQFVRFVTLWNISDGVFFMRKNTKAKKKKKNGFLESNFDNIPEIRMADKPPKKKRTHI